jgi:hypothetical protein
MERLGARDLPWVMLALRRLIGWIGMTLLSAMVFFVGGWKTEEVAKYTKAQ